MKMTMVNSGLKGLTTVLGACVYLQTECANKTVYMRLREEIIKYNSNILNYIMHAIFQVAV